MLENFLNEAFSVIEDVSKPAFNDIVKDHIDQVIEKVSHPYGEVVNDNMAPASFAAGYLFELTGEDYHDYILGCYVTNSNLTYNLQCVIDYYAAGNRTDGD